MDFSGAAPPTSLLWQSRRTALLGQQHRPRLDRNPPGPVCGPRLVFMHLPESSLSPTPTWKTPNNHQMKPVVCPCAHCLELLRVLPVKVTSKGTASICVFQKYMWLPNPRTPSTHPPPMPFFPRVTPATKSLVDAGRWLWLVMNGVSRGSLWGRAEVVAGRHFFALRGRNSHTRKCSPVP